MKNGIFATLILLACVYGAHTLAESFPVVMASPSPVPAAANTVVHTSFPLVAGLTSWNWAAIFAFLFFASEALGTIPAVKANSIYQLAFGLIKTAFEKSGGVDHA